jgi:acetate---CoA ligase (ADP-forming) subunit beta
MTVKRRLEHFLATRQGAPGFLEHEVKGLLRDLGVSVPRGLFIPADAPLPSRIDFCWPLVAKVASLRVPSKTDAGGIRFAIGTTAALEQACAELLRIDGAEGILVEETVPPGIEVIVGGTVDPQFGPLVMFGLGGLFVELFREVAFALAPITRAEAIRLIERTRCALLIHGFRGKPPLDREALANIMVTVGQLVGSGLLEEIDLNPVVLYPRGAVVLDAKMKPATAFR